MQLVYVIVEGATENIFIKRILEPYITRQTDGKLILYPTQNETSSGFRGGVVSYQKLIDNIVTQAKIKPNAYITTLIDYYGLDKVNFPQYQEIINNKSLDIYEKIEQFEKQMELDIQNDCNQRFIPYIQLHEFEALYFADLDRFLEIDPIWNEKQKMDISNILLQAKNQPELINGKPETAPSKRLRDKLCYGKVHHSKLFASYLENNDLIDSAITNMSERCPHFNEWLTKVLKLAE